jgi:CRP-like cAMP-binding protein
MEQSAIERLKQISLFQKIRDNDEYMGKLEEICTYRAVSGGQVVIQEGEKGSEMFIMLSGRVEIQRKTRAGDSYTVAKLRAENNVFFGEMALIDDDVRSATIIATEDSEFMVITKGEFIALGETHPQIALPITRVIAQILASRLRNTTGDMLTIFDALVNELQQ